MTALEKWKKYSNMPHYIGILMFSNQLSLDELNYFNEMDFIQDEMLFAEKKYYEEVVLPEVDKNILELKKEIGEEFKSNRLEYLKNNQSNLRVRLEKIYKDLERISFKGYSYLEKYFFDVLLKREVLEKDLKNIETDIFFLENNSESNSQITQEMITIAKSFPINRILSFNSLNFVRCPYHEEKTASMSYWKKQNLAHCFGCGVTKDSIQLVIDLNNISFVDAVKELCKQI